MALPDFSMRQLLEAGVHFGHQTHRWNPKMKPYIFGDRSGIHIIDLAQSVPMLHQALKVISDTVAGGGRVLFVGTKRQASDLIADAARRSAQYYVNSRWLGGMMTNWKTISNSIQRLRKVDDILNSSGPGYSKKERLNLEREREKLEKALGGIRNMGGTPDLMVVIDTNKEKIAIDEAKRLGIPVVAIIDSNCDPDLINYAIPGNDDASRAIALYCDLFARAALDGISRQQGWFWRRSRRCCRADCGRDADRRRIRRRGAGVLPPRLPQAFRAGAAGGLPMQPLPLDYPDCRS